MDESTWIHRIALSMLKGIGPVHARNLVAYCGGVDPIFTDRKLKNTLETVSSTHLRAHETVLDLVCRLLLEQKNKHQNTTPVVSVLISS